MHRIATILCNDNPRAYRKNVTERSNTEVLYPQSQLLGRPTWVVK